MGNKHNYLKSHTLYVADDFTEEEYARHNQLAIMVLDGGLAVCKDCGEYEAGLDKLCRARGRPISLRRAKKLRKRGEYVWWSEHFGTYAWKGVQARAHVCREGARS